MSSKKILFVTTDLSFGGAQKIICFLASYFNSFCNVYLIVFSSKINNKITPPDFVKIIYLNKNNTLRGIISYALVLEKLQPNIVFSSISNLNIVNGLFSKFIFKRIKFIAREASVVSEMSKFSSNSIISINYLIKVFYPFLDKIVVQSMDMLIDLNKNYNLPQKKLVLIHNPITSNFILKFDDCQSNSPLRIITIARLSKEKGIDRIINSLSHVKRNFKYTLIGEGPLKDEILGLINFHGLNNKFELISNSNNINNLLINSDLYIQGSYVEGFPNSVLDANYCGIPVFAFESLGGTKEIIYKNINGFIFKNENELVELIESFQNKIWDRKIIRSFVQEKFNSQKIMTNYKKLFLDED
jgi:glycosyltransferase involved in cell wall biosynthesis